MPKITDTFLAKDRATWRCWLERHGSSKTEIWLVFYKKKHVEKTGAACVSYDEAVEEALCFGWIDGILKRIDDTQHVIRFSPRKPRSVWSESNKKRVRRLTKEKRMTEAGLALVRAAKKDGRWARDKAVEEAQVPDDLAAALARNKKARACFDGFALSYRRSYIHWVLDAKRAETRKRRIREVVRRSAQNKKPGM
jgi:uncharacterized protein YdeI (YjbR/CyaY-like superfamily)